MLLLGLGWLLSDSSAADMTQSADLIPISPKETRKGDPKTTMWTQDFLTQPCAASNRSLRHAGHQIAYAENLAPAHASVSTDTEKNCETVRALGHKRQTLYISAVSTRMMPKFGHLRTLYMPW